MLACSSLPLTLQLSPIALPRFAPPRFAPTHVRLRSADAADLKNGQVLNTLAGQTLKVSLIDSTVKFTSSSGSVTQVIFPDVDSSNA